MPNVPLAAMTHLVVHHSAGPRSQTFEQIQHFHTTPENQGGRGFRAIGYHALIFPDGKLRQGRPLPQQGAHAQGWNGVAIGLCLVGDNTRSGEEWTAEQLFTAKRYVDALDLVVPGLVIVPHRDVVHTLCPGIDRGTLLRMLGR